MHVNLNIVRLAIDEYVFALEFDDCPGEMFVPFQQVIVLAKMLIPADVGTPDFVFIDFVLQLFKIDLIDAADIGLSKENNPIEFFKVSSVKYMRLSDVEFFLDQLSFRSLNQHDNFDTILVDPCYIDIQHKLVFRTTVGRFYPKMYSHVMASCVQCQQCKRLMTIPLFSIHFHLERHVNSEVIRPETALKQLILKMSNGVLADSHHVSDNQDVNSSVKLSSRVWGVFSGDWRQHVHLCSQLNGHISNTDASALYHYMLDRFGTQESAECVIPVPVEYAAVAQITDVNFPVLKATLLQPLATTTRTTSGYTPVNIPSITLRGECEASKQTMKEKVVIDSVAHKVDDADEEIIDVGSSSMSPPMAALTAQTDIVFRSKKAKLTHMDANVSRITNFAAL